MPNFFESYFELGHIFCAPFHLGVLWGMAVFAADIQRNFWLREPDLSEPHKIVDDRKLNSARSKKRWRKETPHFAGGFAK